MAISLPEIQNKVYKYDKNLKENRFFLLIRKTSTPGGRSDPFANQMGGVFYSMQYGLFRCFYDERICFAHILIRPNLHTKAQRICFHTHIPFCLCNNGLYYRIN
jgi:hypothetical protein